jgi:PilZ domain
METMERRRSDRVSLFSAIRVRGNDAAGEAFSVEARTVLVTLHGAAVIINRELAASQRINIRCYGMDTEAEARVVGRIEKRPEGFLYGLQFLDPAVNPWNIKFPAAGPAPNAVGRLLLQCGECQQRELVYLDELELEVFGANRGLSRFCSACQKLTTWRPTPHEMPSEENGAPAPAEEAESAASLVPRTRNDRQYVRVRMKLKACIRHPELGEEVVDCEDVSRGGVSFLSQKQYTRDALIEAAVPYLAGQANIFTRARIANLRPIADRKGFTKYGVSYIS